MAIKIYKPTTPGRRKSSVLDTKKLSKKRPEKSLTVRKKRHAGRNNSGSITVRHQGGGGRKLLRKIDSKRDKFGIPATVKAIEYDPNRSANIMLLVYKDGEKRYSLAPTGIKVNTVVISDIKTDAKKGNRMKIANIPLGSIIHDIELTPGNGGQMAKSAGNYATLQAVEGGFALLKLPSTEIRRVRSEGFATIGQVSNPDWSSVRWGKAGRMRHRGIRPTVTGKSMNPVDHPHGGGEGHQPVGRHPKTPWGKTAMGLKTRKKKDSDKLILKKRVKKRRKK